MSVEEKSIKERFLDVSARLKKHDAQRKVLEGELKAIRHECEHPNAKRGTRSIMGRETVEWFCCPDCGKEESW